jgi:hypothetical protein
MGSIWLDGRSGAYPALDMVIRSAGVPIKLYSGWQTRSRSSGGFTQLLGIVCHHTASPSSQGFQSCWDYLAVGHPDSPVANMILGRDGTVGVHAAGASNHAGKGGPANSYCIGIEAQNDGVGENWSPAMMESYEKMCAAMCSAYGLQASDCIAHREWAPSRKIDPWGGNQATAGFVYTGPRMWPMRGGQGFCDGVARRMSGGPDTGDEDFVFPWFATRSA